MILRTKNTAFETRYKLVIVAIVHTIIVLHAAELLSANESVQIKFITPCLDMNFKWIMPAQLK